MLLRWARSNVRENLVMFSFITKRFRPYDSGSNWIRLFSVTQLFRLTFGEACKFAVLAQLIMNPVPTLILISIGCLASAILPSIVYQKQYHSMLGWQWALPFSFYWVFALSWIPLWGLITAARTGWLTRETVIAPDPKKAVDVPHAHGVRDLISKAA
jgi:hyaluronan synthase